MIKTPCIYLIINKSSSTHFVLLFASTIFNIYQDIRINIIKYKVPELQIQISFQYLLQILSSLSWQDLSRETRAAHRSGSLRPSKLSSSAATRFKLSSAYLENN